MLDVILGLGALYFGKNVIKSTLNAVDQNVPNVINKAAYGLDNITAGVANATDSLPTYGQSIAATHLMDMEKELTELNAKNGTNYKNYKEIIAKYKKLNNAD